MLVQHATRVFSLGVFGRIPGLVLDLHAWATASGQVTGEMGPDVITRVWWEEWRDGGMRGHCLDVRPKCGRVAGTWYVITVTASFRSTRGEFAQCLAGVDDEVKPTRADWTTDFDPPENANVVCTMMRSTAGDKGRRVSEQRRAASKWAKRAAEAL